jgi:hypothetical protein
MRLLAAYASLALKNHHREAPKEEGCLPYFNKLFSNLIDYYFN